MYHDFSADFFNATYVENVFIQQITGKHLAQWLWFIDSHENKMLADCHQLQGLRFFTKKKKKINHIT